MLDSSESIGQIECGSVQSKKQQREYLQPEGYVERVIVRHSYKGENARHCINSESCQRPRHQTVQRRNRQRLEKSHHAQVEKADCPDQENKSDKVQVHHECPPPFAHEHEIAKSGG